MDEFNIRKELFSILDELFQGDPSILNDGHRIGRLNAWAIYYKNKPDLTQDEVDDLGSLLRICNILYNNTDAQILPVDDGLYDLILEKYKAYNPNYQVGADVIHFNATNQSSYNIVDGPICPIEPFDPSNLIEPAHGLGFGYDVYDQLYPMDWRDVTRVCPLDFDYKNAKRVRNTAHEHPDLVGTLDKVKFVLCKDAEDAGVLYDQDVKILERDFFQDHIRRGIIFPDREYTMILELKYDGVSVEADCSTMVESARSRGDTGIGMATDMTPILQGYKFPHSDLVDPIGVKFEAIMTYPALYEYNRRRGKQYANCRTAISGLIGSSDGYLYQDLITLVPLQADIQKYPEYDPLVEIEFLNKYFASGEALRHVVITGNYQSLLYQIKVFQDEVEYLRAFLPFMYDGIVCHYYDEDVRKALGRENHVNKWSVAVKFNPMTRQTRFRGYSFTVGMTGNITPMIHYDPVEFFGTVHPKSSGHSLDRFLELGLRLGDIIDVTYRNDVITYVTRPHNDHNDNNPNPPVPFITNCPECGEPIEISESGKSARCINVNCPGRKIARATNMLKRLGFKGFGESFVKAIGKYHLTELMTLTESEIAYKLTDIPLEDRVSGLLTPQNYLTKVMEIMSTPAPDYQLYGALGITGVSNTTFKTIFKEYHHYRLYESFKHQAYDRLVEQLSAIKGIGPSTANTIVLEIKDQFMDDITFVEEKMLIQSSYGISTGKKIRFTGVRDRELSETLRQMGYDADPDGSVTKDTDILIVPLPGHTSSKTKKAGPNTKIVPINDFKMNMRYYLEGDDNNE